MRMAISTSEITMDKNTNLGKYKHTANKDGSPNKLKGDRNTICRMIVAVLGSIIDNGGQQKTDRDSPLVQRDDGATNPLW